jgi:hypothetical protein
MGNLFLRNIADFHRTTRRYIPESMNIQGTDSSGRVKVKNFLD